jgi:hypothetical protein
MRHRAKDPSIQMNGRKMEEMTNANQKPINPIAAASTANSTGVHQQAQQFRLKNMSPSRQSKIPESKSPAVMFKPFIEPLLQTSSKYLTESSPLYSIPAIQCQINQIILLDLSAYTIWGTHVNEPQADLQ